MKTHPDALSKHVGRKINFHTLSGKLIVDVSSDDGTILMDFPANPPRPFESNSISEEVANVLGLSKSTIVNIEVAGNGYAVIEVEQSVEIAVLDVDSSALVCQFSMLTSGSCVSRLWSAEHYSAL
jgi:predicted PhzF superfamily epimerase YddE/YHI9